jgi:glycine/D-amino acid oxidase-like deaminating enzyme
VRVGIVGRGLAGSLLAWRLAQAAPGWHIDLIGRVGGADATTASGGAVRSFELHPEQRRLALLSMAELVSSPTLRDWAGFRQIRAVYLSLDHATVGVAAKEIETYLPGSVQVLSPAELAHDGWANLTGEESALCEQNAGSVSPARLRDCALADAGESPRVQVQAGTIESVVQRDNGLLQCAMHGQRREYDAVVVAAGAWTSQLFQRWRLPAAGHRVKSIQYSVFATGSWQPPQFVDEIGGVFGLPMPDNELLLGAPSQEWDVDPDQPPVTAALHRLAADRARARFPGLELGGVRRQVGSADCYSDRPYLSLRRVAVDDHQLFTFSGGAGGSAKTVLAASALAASRLMALDRFEAEPLSTGEVEVHHDR